MTSNKSFTPTKALELQKPTDNFLCSSTNAYGILFESFVISNPKNDILFAIGIADDEIIKRSIGSMSVDLDMEVENDQDVCRKIKYTFPASVLRQNRVSSILTFSTYQPLKQFRMIERHYFRSKLIKSYDFSFGFCIPDSRNTWETLLDVPALDAALVKEMIRHPFETKSDTFYFVGDELVIHNKASYRFFDDNDRTCSHDANEYDIEEHLSELALHK